MKHLAHFSLTLAAAATLAACGGGGSDPVVTPTPTPTPTAVTTLDGVAAVGAAISGGSVTAKCAAGTPETGKTTGTDGSYTLKLNGATAPCMVQVSGGTINGVANAQALHGFATEAGTVNVTPLTELALAQAVGGEPATAFNAFSATTASGVVAKLEAARSYVGTQLTALGLSAPTGNIFSAPFKVGDASDKLLDNLGTLLTDKGTTLAEVRSTAAANTSLADKVNAPRKVALDFAAVAGNSLAKCGTQLAGLGSTGVSADVKDLRFYVTNLALVNAKGEAVPVTLDANEWQLTKNGESVALIDLEDATGACATASNTTATNAVITGTVPAGNYVGVKASMGVPETLNHSAITGGAAPLDNAAMAWSWQSGRKFAKIELNPVGGITKAASGTTPASTISTFNFHLGSTGCTAKTDAGGAAVKDAAGNTVYTCTNPNLMDFKLDSFNPSTQKVVLDVAQLFGTTLLTQENGGAAGCMSGATDPECPVMFTELQVGFGSGSDGKSINGGAAQKIFKAVSKADLATKANADRHVALQFAAVNGSTPVKCGTQLTGMGTTGVAADVKDLRFYISNLALVNDQGVAVPVKLNANNWQLTSGTEAVSLIDLEDATGTCATASNTTATNAVITGTVPAGNYVGVKASMGVPETLNHSAITGGAAPLDNAAMAWSWQSGRKFAKIELNPVGGITKAASGTTPASTISTFNFHLGSTGCAAKTDAGGVVVKDAAGNTVYTCTNPNVMDFKLDSFNPSSQKVVLDLAKLFGTTLLTQENGGAAGCMSGATDPECPVMFTELQVGFGSGSDGKSINGGAAQKIFKAALK